MFGLGGTQAQDPNAAYSQLNAGQITHIAQEFIQRFQGVNDPKAQQLAQTDPQTASPSQVAEMHQYAAQHHPEILAEVMKQPEIAATLGTFAMNELRKHMGQQH